MNKQQTRVILTLVLTLTSVGLWSGGSLVTTTSVEGTTDMGWKLTSNVILTNVSVFIRDQNLPMDTSESLGLTNSTEEKVSYKGQNHTHQLVNLDYNGEVSDSDLYNDFQSSGWERVEGKGWYRSGYQNFQEEGIIQPVKEHALSLLNQDADQQYQQEDLIVEYDSISELELEVEMMDKGREKVRALGQEQKKLVAQLQIQANEENITIDLTDYLAEVGMRDEGTPIKLSSIEEIGTGHQVTLNYTNIQSINFLVSSEPSEELGYEPVYAFAGILIVSTLILFHRKRT